MPARRSALALATIALAGVYAVPLMSATASGSSPDRSPAAAPSGAAPSAASHRSAALPAPYAFPRNYG